MRLDIEIRGIFGKQSVDWNNILESAAAIEWSEWQRVKLETLALDREVEQKANNLLALAKQSNININTIVRNAVAYAAPDKLPIVFLVLTKMLHDKYLEGKARDWLAQFPKPGPTVAFLASFIKGEFRPKQRVFAQLLSKAQNINAETVCITNLLLCSGRLPNSSSDLFSILARFRAVRRVDETQLFTFLGKLYRRRRLKSDLTLNELQNLPKPWQIHILDDEKRSRYYLTEKLLGQLSAEPYMLEETRASRRAVALVKSLEAELRGHQVHLSTLQGIASTPELLERLDKQFNWTSVNTIAIPTCKGSTDKNTNLSLMRLNKFPPSRPAANVALLILIWLSHHASKPPDENLVDLKRSLVHASPEIREFCIRACRGTIQRDVVETIRASKIPGLGVKAISDLVLAGQLDENTDMDLLLHALDVGTEKRKKRVYRAALKDPKIGLRLLENSATFRAQYLSSIKRGNPPNYCVTPAAFHTYGMLADIGGELIEVLLSKVKNIRPPTTTREMLQKVISEAPGSAPAIFGLRGISGPKFVRLISSPKFNALTTAAQANVFELQTPTGKNAFRDALRRGLVSRDLLRQMERKQVLRTFLARYTPMTLKRKKATVPETLSSLVFMPVNVEEVSKRYSTAQLRKALPKAVELLGGRTRVSAALELAVLSDLSALPLFLLLVQRLGPPFTKSELGKRFDHLYTTYELPKKSGGNRVISAPAPHLKKAQRALLNLLYKEEFSSVALGFRPGKSIRDNATLHVGQNIVVNADIQRFFPSTSYKKVYALSRRIVKEGLSPMSARLFSEICCHAGCLATGAPTSPAVSNLILKPVDDALVKTSKKLDVVYSRYADDLTFSGNGAAVWMLKPLQTHLARLDYKLDPKKTNIFRRGRRQTVTGAVVNEKVNLARPLRKKLRAAVHQRINGKQPHMHGQPLNDEALKGHISYLSMLSTEHAKPLLKQLEALDGWKC